MFLATIFRMDKVKLRDVAVLTSEPNRVSSMVSLQITLRIMSNHKFMIHS